MSRFIPAPAPTAPDARIALLRAHSEILSRLALYARAVDRLDEQLIIRQFWPDCEIDMGAVQGTGHAALSTKVLKIFATQQHPVSNVRIVLDASGTRARSEATLTARSLLKVPGSKDAWVVSGLNGRYLDEWELRDDEWRIRKRKLVQDFATTTPIRGDPSYSSARSVEDPSYAFFGEIDVSKVIPKDQKQLEDAAEIVDRLYSFSIGRDSDDVKLMKRCVWSEKMVGKKV